MTDEPKRNEGEPCMVYRGRLMYWSFDMDDQPPYETLSVTERSHWTMLASGMDRIMKTAPRDTEDAAPAGFTPHAGGPGIVGHLG
jgi:hypothetical protein